MFLLNSTLYGSSSTQWDCFFSFLSKCFCSPFRQKNHSWIQQSTHTAHLVQFALNNNPLYPKRMCHGYCGILNLMCHTHCGILTLTCHAYCGILTLTCHTYCGIQLYGVMEIAEFWLWRVMHIAEFDSMVSCLLRNSTPWCHAYCGIQLYGVMHSTTCFHADCRILLWDVMLMAWLHELSYTSRNLLKIKNLAKIETVFC